jgi:putative effector of murein hydrolase
MLRWLLSGVIMYMAYPLMNKFRIKNELIKLLISSVFGSIVFFKLDKLLLG